MNPGNFFAELKRRNVYKVAVTYAVVGWLLIQVTATIVPALHLPDGLITAVVVLVLVGFPIALVISWAFELTPEGLKPTADVSPEGLSRLPYWSKKKYAGFIVGIAVIAAGLLAFQLFRVTSTSSIRATGSEIPEKSIAVLPFDNLSDEKANAYLAEGIQDEILTRLASVADLKVISRTSTAKYQSKPEDLKMVSQELGVAKVMEGTVQRAGDQVRINLQLIDARADSHLWAKTYDRGAKDIFAVESEVSQEVAEALQAKLSPVETQRLAGAPTANTEAYDLFLKAEFEEREAESSLKADDYDRAAALYGKALQLEPKFALAQARLVMNRMQRHWYIDHLSDAELQPIQDEADRALQLAPDLPEAHIARGVVYYFGHRQYEEALAEFANAIRLQPNNARALEFSGYVLRRLGRWKDSLADLMTSLEQDPRSSNLHAEIAVSYGYLRMWKEAQDFAQRALAINPHEVSAIAEVVASAISGRGDVAQASQFLATVPRDNFLLPDFSHAGGQGLIGYRALIALLDHDPKAALEVFGDGAALDPHRRYCARVVILILSNQNARARTEAEKALSEVETKLRERPKDLDAIAEASWIYLALDRSDDAIAMAKRDVALLPPEKDALVGPIVLVNLAQIECRAGHAVEAIEILRRLLAIPAGAQLSIPTLRIHPVWDPIRNEAAFQQLLTVQQRVGP